MQLDPGKEDVKELAPRGGGLDGAWACVRARDLVACVQQRRSMRMMKVKMICDVSTQINGDDLFILLQLDGWMGVTHVTSSKEGQLQWKKLDTRVGVKKNGTFSS